MEVEPEEEFPKTVDPLNDDYTEKDLPNEFREHVIISESPSHINPTNPTGPKAQADKSSTTTSSAKKLLSFSVSKAPTFSVKNGPKLNEKFRAQSPSSPSHRITWDGTDKTCESDGQTCPLCEKDLSTSTLEEDEFEYYDRSLRTVNLPDVAVLACGHSFHSECLESITPEDQLRDPPCFFCLSCIA